MENNIKIDWEYYISLRHELHTIPELGYCENKTSKRITEELERLGIPYENKIAGTGIVATIKKGKSESSIALRADLDALPISENSGAVYASKQTGTMHACGHDGHMAMLLAAADGIRKMDFDGTVHLIFQPAEEGGAGAKKMIEAGLFERYKIDKVYGMHNRPSEELGTFLIKEGPVMTSVDNWTITVKGRSGHSSQPHNTVNPIVVASHIVLAVKSISSLSINPAEAHVVTVAQISAGTAFNVIPDSCRIEGSVRAFNPDVQHTIEKRLLEISEGIARGFNAEAELEYHYMYPPTLNSDIKTAKCAAASVVGEKKIKSDFPSSMGSEDFSFLLEKKPGCYVWLGTKQNPNEETIPLHNSKYDFNDNAISIGARYWMALVEEELGKKDEKKECI